MECQDSFSFSGVSGYVVFGPEGRSGLQVVVVVVTSLKGVASLPNACLSQPMARADSRRRMIHSLAMSSGECKVGKEWLEVAFEWRCGSISHSNKNWYL